MKAKLFSKFNLIFLSSLLSLQIFAQGTWAPLNKKIPYPNGGVMVMLLLPDGTVMAKTDSLPNDTIGTGTWSKLTPDIHGSYLNGTWANISPMRKNRLYFSSQVLKDGRVLIVGGENGNGTTSAELYDPAKDTWTYFQPPGTYLDGNSQVLPDGKVLVSKYASISGGFIPTEIYDPVNNTWSSGPSSLGNMDEASMVKLPDNSIVFIDIFSKKSERYIPSLNKFIADDTLPVMLYDPYGEELGPAFLLPDGRAFFTGAVPATAYYTPSGDTSKGTWATGPALPSSQGIPDGSGAMMVDGKILLVLSPQPIPSKHFPKPTTFYEFDYLTNTFTQVKAPDGTDTLRGRTADCNMLDLPDGTVLYSNQGSSQCYVYTPAGAPLAAGKPTVNSTITQNGCTFTITGTLFNGISEGANYGDDWQQATNRPIVRLTSGSNVYYARTFNWNRTGVQTGSLPDTTQFMVPWTVPSGTYSLVVVANGIASNPVTFNYTYNPCDKPAKTLDAGVASIFSPTSGTICGSMTVKPQIIIRNFGSDTLKSCKINYNIDSNPNQVYNWTGSLANLEADMIYLPSTLVSTTGTHTFTSSTSNPNSGTDVNTANDQMQVTFNVLSNVASTSAPYVEGFENSGFPYTDCYLTSQTDSQWMRVTTASATGSACMELENYTPMGGDVDEFITPVIDMSTVTSPTMSFKLSHAQRNSFDVDKLVVYTSTNCGGTWSQRYSKSGAALANAGIISTPFTPSAAGDWRQENVSVINVAGQKNVRFKFQFSSNGSGNNIYIDDINITGVGAGVAEQSENNFNLSIYPNPNDGNFNVSFDVDTRANYKLQLRNVLGQVIYEEVLNNFSGSYLKQLNTAEYGKGVYMISLTNDKSQAVKKVIVY